MFKRCVRPAIRVVADDDFISELPSKGFFDSYVHVDTLVRVTHYGHLIVRPSFLEESMRCLRFANVIAAAVYPVVCIYKLVRRHHEWNYIKAMRAVADVEEATMPAAELAQGPGCIWPRDKGGVRPVTERVPDPSLSLRQFGPLGHQRQGDMPTW